MVYLDWTDSSDLRLGGDHRHLPSLALSACRGWRHSRGCIRGRVGCVAGHPLVYCYCRKAMLALLLMSEMTTRTQYHGNLLFSEMVAVNKRMGIIFLYDFGIQASHKHFGAHGRERGVKGVERLFSPLAAWVGTILSKEGFPFICADGFPSEWQHRSTDNFISASCAPAAAQREK